MKQSTLDGGTPAGRGFCVKDRFATVVLAHRQVLAVRPGSAPRILCRVRGLSPPPRASSCCELLTNEFVFHATEVRRGFPGSVRIALATLRAGAQCPRCAASPVEMVAWADPYQRQSRRLQ
jgi:hypothetical protein